MFSCLTADIQPANILDEKILRHKALQEVKFTVGHRQKGRLQIKKNQYPELLTKVKIHSSEFLSEFSNCPIAHKFQKTWNRRIRSN